VPTGIGGGHLLVRGADHGVQLNGRVAGHHRSDLLERNGLGFEDHRWGVRHGGQIHQLREPCAGLFQIGLHLLHAGAHQHRLCTGSGALQHVAGAQVEALLLTGDGQRVDAVGLLEQAQLFAEHEHLVVALFHLCAHFALT
jgi:hypothetical protein